MKHLKSTALLVGLATACLSAEVYGMHQHQYDCPTQFQWKMVHSQTIGRREWYKWEAPVGNGWHDLSGAGKIALDTTSHQWPVLADASTQVRDPWPGDKGLTTLLCSYRFFGDNQAVIKQTVPYAHCTEHDNPAHDPKRKPFFLCY